MGNQACKSRPLVCWAVCQRSSPIGKCFFRTCTMLATTPMGCYYPSIECYEWLNLLPLFGGTLKSPTGVFKVLLLLLKIKRSAYWVIGCVIGVFSKDLDKGVNAHLDCSGANVVAHSNYNTTLILIFLQLNMSNIQNCRGLNLIDQFTETTSESLYSPWRPRWGGRGWQWPRCWCIQWMRPSRGIGWWLWPKEV